MRSFQMSGLRRRESKALDTRSQRPSGLMACIAALLQKGRGLRGCKDPLDGLAHAEVAGDRKTPSARTERLHHAPSRAALHPTPRAAAGTAPGPLTPRVPEARLGLQPHADTTRAEEQWGAREL